MKSIVLLFALPMSMIIWNVWDIYNAYATGVARARPRARVSFDVLRSENPKLFYSVISGNYFFIASMIICMLCIYFFVIRKCATNVQKS